MDHPQNIYEKILKLPLFQGMSKNELTQVLTQTKFEFIKVTSAKKQIIQEGETCTHIYFLLNGTLTMTTAPDDRRFLVTEKILAPEILLPEYSFGMTQRYSSTFTAETMPCQLLRIQKKDIIAILEQFNIFRINILNILATQSQRQTHQLWRAIPNGRYQKMLRFFETHCRRPAGEKHFSIKMQQLAAEIGESRLNVSRELNQMESNGLIKLSRGQIHIPALEQLLM